MAQRRSESRPGTKLWLIQAERDRLHPAAMAYVYADPARLGPVPGAWDAISDLLRAGIPPARYPGLVGGPAACRAFEAFAGRVAGLPDPGAVLGLSGAAPARVAIDEPGLAFAHVVGLVRNACGRPGAERGAAAERLCAYAADHLCAELARWAMDLAEGPHGLKLDAGLPGVSRCLELAHPGRARDRLDERVAHRP